jgi:hypothetical protein
MGTVGPVQDEVCQRPTVIASQPRQFGELAATESPATFSNPELAGFAK